MRESLSSGSSNFHFSPGFSRLGGRIQQNAKRATQNCQMRRCSGERSSRPFTLPSWPLPKMSNVSFWIGEDGELLATEVVGKSSVCRVAVGCEEAGNAAVGFDGAIEAAVHFVKKGLAWSQLRKQERARIAVQCDSADGSQHGEYGRGFSPACEIAVCCCGVVGNPPD